MKKLSLVLLLLFFTTPAFAISWNNGGGGGGTAGDTTVDASGFAGNLGVGDADVQTALSTLDAISLGGDTTETNQDDAWAAVAGGTETGVDVTYQDATNDVDFIVDVTPSSGSATLEISEDAVQVKYDSTDFQEGANGIYLGDDPTIVTSLSIGTDPGDAATGINLDNAAYVVWEADAAGTDIQGIGVDSSEVVQIGASGASGVTITPATTITGKITTGSSIELGHASDTTIKRDSAGVISVEDAVVTLLGATIGASEVDADVATQAEIDLKAPLASPTFTGIVTFPIAATPTTDTDGDMSFDTDGWGTGFDALEIFNGTASAYVVATTATDGPTDGQVPKWNTGGEITWEDDDDTGGTPIAITVADSTDTTSSVAFFESATGDLGPKTDSQLTYNATTGALTAVSLVGTTDIETALGAAYDTSGELDALFNAKAPLASPTFTGTLTVPVGLTGVLRADTGVMSVDGDVTDLVTDGDDDGSTKGIVSFDNDDFNATSGNVTLATTSTAAELNYLDITTLGTGVASKAVVLNGSGNYTAPAGTWDLSGVTGITLQAGEIVLADLAAGVYAKDIVTTSPVTGAADNVLVGADSDVTLALDFTATWDFGGATALEIPNGTSSPASTTGSIALDTNGDGAEFDGPMIVVSTSGATMGYIVTTAGLPGTVEDNYVIKYDAGTDLVSWEADDTGSALGGNLASTTNDITTDNTIIQLEDSSTSENLTITFSANAVAITSDSEVASVDFGTINLGTDALYAAGAALAIGDGADDVVAIDSTAWDITGVGAASFVDLTIAKAEPIIVLDGTDNWEIRSDDTGNSLEISSAIGGGVGDNVELEIDTSGNVTATGALQGATVTDGTITLAGNGTVTGLAEGGLPNSTIVGADILDDTIDSGDYAPDSIDNEHINWADIDNLDNEGMPIDFALTADATVADVVAIIFGTSSDWNIEYDETTDDRLEFTNIVGTSGDSDVYWDLNDTADSTFTITNSDGTGEANLVVEGDLTVGTLTQAAKDDPQWYFDPATASESEWWVGINHDSVGDDNDNFEIRQNTTPGNSVEFYIQPDGDAFVTGDLTITGDDLIMTTNTAGMLLIGDNTNYNPTAVGGDATLASNGALSVSDLTIVSEARGDLLTFNPGGVGGWERLAAGTGGYYLTTDGTDVSWAAVSATAADAAGVDGVQYEVGGTFTAEPAFYYTQGSNILTVDAIGVGTEEVVIFTDVATALNEITITNAATTDKPSIIPSGETNVGLIIDSKGTGEIIIGSANAKFSLVSDALDISNAGAITGATTFNSVTADELDELEAIGSTDISAAQWTGLGGATTAGIALWDDAAASNQRTTLGIDTAANLETSLSLGAFASDLLGYADAAAVLSGIGAQVAGATLSSLEGLTIANGSILYGTAADTLAVLAPDNGKFLRSNGAGAPSWQTVAGSGTMTSIKENDVAVGGADIVTLDFLGADFDLAENPDTEVQVIINAAIARTADVDVEMLNDVTGEGTAATYSLFDDNDGTYSFRAIAAGDLPGTLSSGTAITNAALTTPAIGAATGTSLLMTGSLAGRPVITTATSERPLTSAEVSGGIVYVSFAGEVRLPDECDSATGATVMIVQDDVSEVVEIAVTDTLDHVWLDGVDLGANFEIDSEGAAREDDYIVMVCKEANNWHSKGRSGAWTTGGAAD